MVSGVLKDKHAGAGLHKLGQHAVGRPYGHRLGIRANSSHVREESPFPSDLGRLFATQGLRKLPWLEAFLKANWKWKWRFQAVFGLFLFGYRLILPT